MDLSELQAGLANSAYALSQVNEAMKKEQKQKERAEFERDVKVQQLANKPLVEALQEQNRLLKEENERQKEQVRIAEINERLAKIEAKKSKIFAWITFGVSTIIAIVALIVSIIK